MITRDEYMSNSNELHQAYFAQFVTEGTKAFVLRSLSVEAIKKALAEGDEHLNKIKIPYNHMGRGGGWWWDDAPINLTLARKLGEVSKNGDGAPCTYTCIAKAAARMLAE